MTSTQTTSLIELIEEKAPEKLVRLRTMYPNHLHLLTPGRKMGADVDTPGEGIYCELARSGLEVAEREASDILSDLPRKARRAKQIRLVGSVVAAVSSAGVVSSALFGTSATTIASAIVSFLATTISSIAGYLESPLMGTSGFAELIEECLRLEMDIQKTKVALQAELVREQGSCLDVVTSVNDISAKLRRIRIFGDVSRA
ncbi:hypothetical protein AB9F36_23790 [Rhizobium leguminosarum]|uniref:hypothetical protein n=1 Tax=Rhizobium leguminosarum TaxID=384 RepID=UPI003F9983DF